MSVYTRISQAIVLLELHGLFPFEIRKSNQNGRYKKTDVVHLSFKWLGRNTLWGYIVYTTVSIILYLLSRNENSNRMILYGYLVQGFVYYIGYTINIRQFAQVMTSAERVSKKLGDIGDSDSTNTRWRYWICFETFCLFFFTFRETMFVWLENETAVSQKSNFVLLIITIFAGVVNSTLEIHVGILYVLMTFVLKSYFDRLNRELTTVTSCLQDDKAIEKLEFLRVLHAELCDVCDQLHVCFNACLVCIFGTLAVKSLLKVYLVTIIYNRLSLIKDGSTFAILFVYFNVLTSSTQRLFDSSKKLCNIFRKANVFGLSLELQFQLRLAVLQTTTLPINTKALGFFETNRSLIPSILSVVAIYITILMELEAPLDIFSSLLKRN